MEKIVTGTFRMSVIKRHLSQSAKSISKQTPLEYTKPAGVGNFTPEQRSEYEKNGFVVVQKCISPEKLDKFKERFQTICTNKINVPFMTVMKDVKISKSEFQDGEKAITKIQDFTNDDELFEYCCLPEVVDIVKSVTGENVMAMHTMLINKPPDTGSKTSRHPLHQDLYYFPFRPVNNIICAWTAMEKITRENGCLVVVPGSHTGEFQKHSYPDWEGGVNKMYYGIQDFNMAKANLFHVEMEKGDTVFFHPILIHGSGTNKTKGFRKAISCHYASSECDYIDVIGTLQEDFKNEIEVVAMKKYGQKVDITDVWKMKSRLVTGERINL